MDNNFNNREKIEEENKRFMESGAFVFVLVFVMMPVLFIGGSLFFAMIWRLLGVTTMAIPFGFATVIFGLWVVSVGSFRRGG